LQPDRPRAQGWVFTSPRSRPQLRSYWPRRSHPSIYCSTVCHLHVFTHKLRCMCCRLLVTLDGAAGVWCACSIRAPLCWDPAAAWSLGRSAGRRSRRAGPAGGDAGQRRLPEVRHMCMLKRKRLSSGGQACGTACQPLRFPPCPRSCRSLDGSLAGGSRNRVGMGLLRESLIGGHARQACD
jgi:hypothetical protein